MSSKWFLIDYRYLSISFTVDGPDLESPNVLPTLIMDISIRPLFAVHISSMWDGCFRCTHFLIICTSFRSINFECDILETDEFFQYPRHNHSSGMALVIRMWEIGVLNAHFIVCSIGEEWRKIYPLLPTIRTIKSLLTGRWTPTG